MKILLFFHGGSGNRGCEAIVQTAVKIIRDKYPQAYIALASYKPDMDKHIEGLDKIIFHNPNRNIKRFSLLYFRNFINVKFNQSQSISYRLTHKDIIDSIDQFDVFLSIGGDNYCYGDIPDYYELNRLIKAKGKKLLLWGASLGKEDLNAKKIADLKQYDKLVIRESASAEQLQTAGLTNTVLVADGAFLLDKDLLPLPQEWQEGNTIGFNYSPLVEKKMPESREPVLQLLHHIIRSTHYTIAFTPHVIQPENNDYECMQRLIADLGSAAKDRVLLLPDHLTAAQYKGYVARMELFIGARTHATIAAYSTCVPTMVLGYSIKSLGIAKDLFGYPRLVLDKSELRDATLLIQKFDELHKDKAEIKEYLEKVIPSVKVLAMSANQYV
jgi:colanic acid/amylovoran biosynthesis protein